MINVCQHPLSARVNVYLNHKTIEQCSKCSIAVKVVEAPVEIPEVGDWVPEVYTGHLQAYYAGRPHEAKTPPTPMTMVNENYFEREFENLKAQAHEILTRLNRVSHEFYSVLHHDEMERKQATCQHKETYKFNMGYSTIRKCLGCRKRLS